ncbi:MAG: tRNA pseudouridine(13) synthase TruD [Desulfurococcales archaeon]|nr:tRNA pseudouridine(13) synthase TruD [Desulfurococcales archaeon]
MCLFSHYINRVLECLWGIADHNRLPTRPNAYIPRPEGFIVVEPRPLEIQGDYSLYLVKKKNLTTLQATGLLKSMLGARKVTVSGLKDKEAIAYQYMYVLDPQRTPRKLHAIGRYLEAWLVKTNISEPWKGSHYYNIFRILIRLNKQDIEPSVSQINAIRYFPNYFGPQRFGTCKPDSHISGFLMLRREHDYAYRIEYPERTGRGRIPDKIVKFMVQAYQSYLWNRALSSLVKTYSIEYIIENKDDIGDRVIRLYCPQSKIRVPAGVLPSGNISLRESLWSQILGKILDQEQAWDLLEEMKKYGVSGGIRPILSRPCRSTIKYNNENNVIAIFSLPRGSYATVYLRELFDLDWVKQCKEVRLGPWRLAAIE